MNFETYLNLIMLKHNHVGGTWMVFRAIPHPILQNIPISYIHVHFISFSAIFYLFVSPPSLYTLVFFITILDEQIAFI